MAEHIFTHGRYKGKTYDHVYKEDRKFCQIALEAGPSSFVPENFIQFLLKQTQDLHLNGSVIKERGCPHFLKACTKEMLAELRRILDVVRIHEVQVHERCDRRLRPNGNLGVFYHFFIKKHVFNLTNVDGRCKYIENYASVFPFRVSKTVATDAHLSIFDVLDLDFEFKMEIQFFLDEHFDNVNFGDVCQLFLLNIYQFKETRFSSEDLVKSSACFQFGSEVSRVFDKFGSRVRHPATGVGYLKTFPRLNRTGIERYKKLYDTLVSTMNFFKKSVLKLSRKYDDEYFAQLPEINFLELYSLLSKTFFSKSRKEYVKKFKKYIFFFVHALNSETNPVFFIDDGLFECLKSLQKFKKSREDVFELKYVLAMMTLVYRRKQPIDQNFTELNEQNLQHVKDYVQSLPNIESAIVDYEVRTNMLESTSLVTLEDVCLDACFRVFPRNSVNDFYDSILHAALSPKNVSKLIIYNAFLGVETWIKMPECKEKILEFIRTYNKYDFSVQLPPEKPFTWGFEKCFVPGTVHCDN